MGYDRSLEPIFTPHSVAVIGASPRRGTIGHQLIHNIIQFGFNGMLFPVNPTHEFIHSIKCYPSVLDISDPVDLAIIAVAKEHVNKVAEECGRKGVKGLVIISAGFREIGGEGVVRERKLGELQKQFGFRVVGPNCMGVINADPSVRLNATFAPVEPKTGSMAFMTQSGALGVAILVLANKLDLGFSYFASVGNKVDITGNNLLEYWSDDEKTKVIAMYLESFGDPRRFTELAKRVTKHKPIILVKSGRTAAGARAASSHTGHLAGLEIAVDALLHQCGVIRVSSIEELMDLALAFSRNPMPRGDRLCILTNAGGPAIMATDVAVSEGLTMATISSDTEKKLKKILAEEASVRNPIDMIAGAGPDEYREALKLVLEDDGVDVAIVIFVPPMLVEPINVVENIAEVSRQFDKPVLSVLMAEERYYEEIPGRIDEPPPIYRFPESAVRAVADMNRHRQWRERPDGKVLNFDTNDERVKTVIRKHVGGEGFLPPGEVNELLRMYGFPVCQQHLVQSDGDVIAAAKQIGYPVALKAFGEEIVHKSDFGGVIVDIANEQELAESKTKMEADLRAANMWNGLDGYVVQEMAEPGKEIILGMTTDPKFGPILMFGMGGKYVEIIQDLTFRLMPVTDLDAWEMVRGIKSYPLLEGVRGEKRVDVEFIVESVQRLAQMVARHPYIAELDMNPVIVSDDRSKCRVVDARIRTLHSPAKTPA